MRRFVLLLTLCVVSLSVYASQTRIPGSQHQILPQYVKDMKTELVNATAAEVDTTDESILEPDTTGGMSSNYCTAGVNSQSTQAFMSHGGTLNLADTSFQLHVTGAVQHPAGFGMFTYGSAQFVAPFGNGTLCISPFSSDGGIHRMPTQALLGSPTLVLAMEDASSQFAQLQPASTWYFQFWYRDPSAGGANFNLSDGLAVSFAP